MAAMYITALSGKIKPLGERYLSLANKTQSSIDSYNKKYTIHSDMIISTLSTGNTTSSIFPLITVILESRLFSLIIVLA